MMITIGQFWHWGLYRQALPIAVWTVFNLVSSSFYLWFWHIQATDANPIGKLITMLQGTTVADFNPTNLVWNLIWFGFALVQAFVVILLVFTKLAATRKQQLEALTA
jgi:hypothetical protein